MTVNAEQMYILLILFCNSWQWLPSRGISKWMVGVRSDLFFLAGVRNGTFYLNVLLRSHINNICHLGQIPVMVLNHTDVDNYRSHPTPINLDRITNCPSQQFVEQQISELKADLATREPEEVLQENSPLPMCTLCMTNRATRLIIPCFHWAGCVACCVRAVETPVYYQIIPGVELVNMRLPLRCHQCNALTGKFARIY